MGASGAVTGMVVTMTDLIVRVYETEEKAAAAEGKLKDAGFAAENVARVSPAAEGAESAVPAEGLERRLAQFYADKVKAGRSVVGVLAPFGTGVLATKLLDSEGPLPEELPRPQAQRPAAEAAYGEGAPFSRALGMQVLSPNAAPFSDMFGWPTKSKKRHFLTSRLGSPHFALSSMFGMGLLSRNGAPLSSKFGLRTLSDNAAPLSSKFGWATASGEAAPLSSKLGWRVLSKNPTPLSSMLGLRVLSEQR
jgi:hypothetical protein